MYHGSPTRDFDSFDLSKINPNDPDAPVSGFWFSEDMDDALRAGKFPYGRPNAPDAQVRPFDITLNNPASRKDVRVAQQQLQAQGIPASNQNMTRYLQEQGFDGYIHNKPVRFTNEQRAQLEATGRVDVDNRYYLERTEGGYLDLYDKRNGEFVTDYDSLDDYIKQNPATYVVFDPNNIKFVSNGQ